MQITEAIRIIEETIERLEKEKHDMELAMQALELNKLTFTNENNAKQD